MENIRCVTVQDVLAARESRAQMQKEWLQKYRLPLLSFTMNIPGPVKQNALICRAFEEGVRRIRRELLRLHACVSDEKITASFTGCEGLWAVEGDAGELKKALCALEDMDELGRLFDMDVIDDSGRHLSREEERPCLICGKRGKGCARSRAHGAEELFEKAMEIIRRHFTEQFIRKTGEMAERALLYEAVTTPKPGLVDCENSGAHEDMDIFIFMHSACALRSYFEDCVRLGVRGADADALTRRALQAEEAMIAAVSVNTHKGAIFALGILCFAMGQCGEGAGLDRVLSAAAVVGQGYLEALRRQNPGITGGEKQYALYGMTGARGEAASGFATVKNIALPAFKKAMGAGKSVNDAGLCALMALTACVQDSNILRRGGMETLLWAQQQADGALRRGADREDLRKLNAAFVQRHISPGGSADLLAVTYFLHFLSTEE